MILSLLIGLLTLELIKADPQFYPQFQQGSGQCTYSNYPGSTFQGGNFQTPFTSVPQIAFGLDHIYTSSLNLKYVIEIVSVNKNGFSVTCQYTPITNLIQFNWLAFLDDSIFVQHGSIATPQISNILRFNNPQIQIPAVSFFITGLVVQASFYSGMYTTIGMITTFEVAIGVMVTNAVTIDTLYYSLIYGLSDTLACNYYHQGINSQLLTYTSSPKIGVVSGILEFVQYSGVFATLQSQLTVVGTTQITVSGDILITMPYGWPSTTFTASFCFYTPACPHFCTSCSIGGYPYCDACVAGTQRLISGNCQTCPGPMYASNNFMNCQQCLNLCQSCTTGDTCTVCSVLSLRISPSTACNQCPALMFVQSGTFICQQCAGYCDNCISESANCVACLTSTGRTNAPLCNLCQSAQQFIPKWSLNCQSCNNYCNGCSDEATQCLACAGGTQRSIPPLCATCPNQMFIQAGFTNCQTCASYCNNCSLFSTTCTSCLLSTQRLQPPNCITCPSNMFIQVGQDDCQQCNPVCNQCLASANNCISCNGLYRTNAPNCDQCSQPNYYIIPSSNDCQLCASFCNGCVTSSSNCLACWPFVIKNISNNCPTCPVSSFTLSSSMCNKDLLTYVCSNNFNRDNSCNCLTGFYNSEISIACLKCSNICNTCTSSSTNCLTCNSTLYLSQPPLCDQCIDGYFMLYGTCTKCSSQCSTCSQSGLNCLTCLSPRLDPPSCSCPQGYFNDCQQTCSLQCSSCTGSSMNCLTCSGNRINPPLCACPDGSTQVSQICSSCQLASPIARFSDELTSIYVIFSSLVGKINCENLLNQITLSTIGSNPICSLNFNIIVITLGSNATITVNQPIFINSDSIYLANCNKSIQTIITPLLQMPSNLFAPNLIFNNQVFITTPCDMVLINIIGSNFSGQRNLKLLNWTITEGINNTKISQLIKLWNSQSLQSSYIITPQYLTHQQSISLTINYTNFLGQVASSTLKIFIQDVSLQLNIQVPDKVYIFDRVEIISMVSLLSCAAQPINEAIFIEIKITNSSTQLHYNYSLQSDEQQSITFKSFELQASNYQIIAIARYKVYTTEIRQTLQIGLADISVTILGGDQMIGINQQISLQAIVLSPNKQQEVNDLTEYSTIWECVDIVTSLQCSNFTNKSFAASLNTLNYKTYTTLYVTISVYNQLKNKLLSVDNITIQIVENYVNQIEITGNQYELKLPMNNYDEVDVTISYQSHKHFDTDHLTYYASYLDSFYQQNLIQFYYLQTSIILQNFNSLQDTKFKVMIYNPEQSGPSQATLKIRINIAPQQCQLNIYPRGSKFTISINSCVSQTQPLQYKFLYYISNDQLIQDSQTGFISNGIELANFQINPVLITYLYGQNTSMIVAIIKDSYNGLSNTSISLANYHNMDSHLLYYMLQDNQQNLPINIMFIMIYSSLNNLILNDQYFNQIQQITNSLNQTNQMIQYIRQQLSLHLSNTEISPELIKINTFIFNISQQLTTLQIQQNQNLYNKNYQIQLITIQQGLIDVSQVISFLYAQSQQVENRRVLGVVNQNMIQMITQAVSSVNDILGQLTKVNQNQKIINTSQFNITAQKFSTLNINKEFKLQIVNQSNQTVQYKNQNFEINPYQNDSDFINPVKAPLIVPNLTGANNIQITPATPIPINFPFIGDINVTCASKLGGSWSLEVCSVVKSSTTLQCLCQTLSPLSITQALEFILGEFENLFKDTISEKIGLFPYGSSLFTYIIIFFLIFYLVSMFQLNRKDNLDYHRVHPDIDVKQLQYSEEHERINIENAGQTSMKVIVVDTKKPEATLFTKTSVIGQVQDNQITKYQGFKIFLQNSHILFELYYRYDEQEPRILRLSILFLQVTGQICIFVLFGKNLAISIVIGLSIFQTTYGILFQLILSQMIKSKNQYIRGIALVIAGLLTGLCTYLIIASMALYSSAYYSNIAALSYLASLCADYFISNILVELGKYTLVLKTCTDLRFYKIYDKILPKGLQEIVFGRILFEAKTKAQIED